MENILLGRLSFGAMEYIVITDYESTSGCRKLSCLLLIQISHIHRSYSVFD